MKKITVIIVDYKNRKDTIACIVSLDKVVVKDIELSIVLVNNDTSTVFESDEFPTRFPLYIINSKTNGGFTGGNNQGMEFALEQNADYILLLNNDTLVDSHLMSELLHVALSQKYIGLISPKIYFAKGSEFHTHYKESERGKVLWYAGGSMDWKNVLGKHRGVDEVDIGQYDNVGETDFATGCCMLIPSEIVRRVGLFDEKYFLYYEDSDFNQRVKQNHYKIYYAPKALIWHKNAGSTGGSGSMLQDYYIARNRLMFGIRYAPLRAKIALIKESLMLLKNGRVWQKRGVKDFYLGKLGKGSYKAI